MRRTGLTALKISAAALPLVFAVSAAATGPAVSEVNLKATATFGSVDWTGSSVDAWATGAALTAPLSQTWGFQVEAGAASVDDTGIYGAAAHVFRRDPESYLAGLFVAYASVDAFDIDATRLGAEGEIYFDQVSILGTAGYQFSDTASDGAFATIDLRLYASDNFVVSAGAALEENQTLGRFSAEWQLASTALPGLALRVDAAIGENDFSSVTGGFTYYFGSDTSLKDRHRRQDPDSALFSLYQSLQSNSAPTPPPPPVDM